MPKLSNINDFEEQGYSDGFSAGYERSLENYTAEQEIAYRRGYESGVADYCRTLESSL